MFCGEAALDRPTSAHRTVRKLTERLDAVYGGRAFEAFLIETPAFI